MNKIFRNYLKVFLEEVILIINCFFIPKKRYALSSYSSVCDTLIHIIRCEIIKTGFLLVMGLVSFLIFIILNLAGPEGMEGLNYPLIGIYFAGFTYLLIQEDYYFARKRAIISGFRSMFKEYEFGEYFHSSGMEKTEVSAILEELLKSYLEPKHREYYTELFKSITK